jgi:hypothetical protein
MCSEREKPNHASASDETIFVVRLVVFCPAVRMQRGQAIGFDANTHTYANSHRRGWKRSCRVGGELGNE